MESRIVQKRKSYQTQVSNDFESQIPPKRPIMATDLRQVLDAIGDVHKRLDEQQVQIDQALKTRPTHNVDDDVFIESGPENPNEVQVISSEWVNTRRGTGKSYRQEPVNSHPNSNSHPSGSRAPISSWRGGGSFNGQSRGRGGRGGHSRPTPYDNRRFTNTEEDDSYRDEDFRDQRRASHSGYSLYELKKMMRQEIMTQRCHEEEASYDIILDGIPSIKGDKFPEESKRAFDRLVQIDPEFKIDYIWDCDRFFTPNDEGFYPMKVTLKKSSQAQDLIDTARLEKKWKWFRPSRTKEMRKKIAYEQWQCDLSNSRLPADSAIWWEVKELGHGVIRRRIPNPHLEKTYQSPTAAGNQRPLAANRMSIEPPTPMTE